MTHCIKCDKPLKDALIIWLELSVTDGNYYENLPSNHTSQGSFPFGRRCAVIQLEETDKKFR